jgi:hypothetical protein
MKPGHRVKKVTQFHVCEASLSSLDVAAAIHERDPVATCSSSFGRLEMISFVRVFVCQFDLHESYSD